MSNKGSLYNFRRKIQALAISVTSSECMSKIYFRIVLHKPLNLRNPVSFNEKIQWLKLFEWPNNNKAIICTDKYGIRKYLEEINHTELLNELYGVWEDAKDIDFDELPSQFVLKCNHGCGYNILCEDKSKLDKKTTIKKINKWMHEDFGKFNAEIHYDKIQKKIICEKFLGGEIIDYKYYCFNGKPRFIAVSKGEGKNRSITLLNTNWELAEFQRGDYPHLENISVPQNESLMESLSVEISKDFPFVRIDWYEVDNKLFMGELTFTPCGGLMDLSPNKYDKILGSYLNINSLISEYNSGGTDNEK